MKEFLKHYRRLLVEAIIRYSSQNQITQPSGSILVIAPHPDDEVFGCGGLIALRRAAGAKVTVAFLTDGEASHDDCCRPDRKQLAASRRGQAEESAAMLGLCSSDLLWLGLPDTRIPARAGDEGFDEAVGKVARIVSDTKPDEICAPHRCDAWQDHENAGFLVSAACARAGFRGPLLQYLVWGWHNMSLRAAVRLALSRPLRLDISEALEAKIRAVANYVSSCPPGCEHPYVGALPKGFLKPFLKPYEVFFIS